MKYNHFDRETTIVEWLSLLINYFNTPSFIIVTNKAFYYSFYFIFIYFYTKVALFRHIT